MVTIKSLVTFAAVAVFSASAAPSVPEPSPTPNGSADDPPVAVARPVSGVEARDLEARQDVGCVLMCGDHFFMGQCYTFCTNNNQCANLGGALNDWVSSLRTTSGSGWTCTYYEHAGCAGASFTSDYDDTLHDSGGWWADRISSIRCYKTGPCLGGPFDPPC